MPRLTNNKQRHLAMLKRTDAYAKRVGLEFSKCVGDMLALFKTLPVLDDGVMFSFDNISDSKQYAVERLLRRLQSVATLAIQQGIVAEWEQANKANDQLVQSCFGKDALRESRFGAYVQRNLDARDAFINRHVGGMHLSDRIWRSCTQLREEMEVAMTVAIGEGMSASNMSRKVRQYLKDPDLMFRRFRYKDEDGNWHKKWKKRITDEQGNHRWIDYDKDSYRVGRGNYRSSAKNAMRVARTETNMAYREADNTRMQQLDFVLGQEVKTSNNHGSGDADICDELAGKYPKDFKFIGWHPQCRCYMTTILADWSEIAKIEQAKDRGEQYTPKGMIEDMPDNFNQWTKANADKIVDAEQRGTLPYFLRENGQYLSINGSHSSAVKYLGGDEFDGNQAKQIQLREHAMKLYAEQPPVTLTRLQRENMANAMKAVGADAYAPMSFVDADTGHTNPNYALGGNNKSNCQSCITVFEMRLRGLNVSALPYNSKTSSTQFLLGEHYEQAWHNPKGGGVKLPDKIEGANDKELIENLNKQTSQRGRYHIGINTKAGQGHTIVMERFGNGDIVLYDPQRNRFWDMDDFKDIQYFETLRVDKLLVRPNILKDISKIVK